MNYGIPEIPDDVIAILEKYELIALKQQSSEASVLFWILNDIQESNEYTSATHWIENNLVPLTIAITTGKYKRKVEIKNES